MPLVMGEFYVTLNSRLSTNCAAACGTIGPHPSETAMPRYLHNPTGVPAGLREWLSDLETRIQSRAAFAVEGFGPRDPDSAEAWPEPEIWQWVIAKLPCGHTTRLSARVKRLHLESDRNQGVMLGRADRGANS